MILLVEMVCFGTLVLPPRSVRKGLLKSMATIRPLLEKLFLALKFTFAFIFILFVDAVNRVYKSQADFEAYKGVDGAARQAMYSNDDVQARRFYAQRNMYLCGFTLFLSLILNRTYVLVVELTNAEDRIRTFESGKGGESAEVSELKTKLKNKEQDIETLKKQSQSLSNEYNRVADELNAKTGDSVSDKKND